jgi:hypothetical protein
MGKTGRGTHEHCGVMGRIDILTGTLGKALGGASGGSTSGRKEIIELLRQRSRPYLFSMTCASDRHRLSTHLLSTGVVRAVPLGDGTATGARSTSFPVSVRA